MRQILGLAQSLALITSSLLLVLVLVTCAPPSPTSPRTAASAPAPNPVASEPAGVSRVDWQAEWDGVLAAARQEGKVAVLGQVGDVYREVWEDFQRKYGITVELLAVPSGSDFAPRIGAERQASQFGWDVVQYAPSTLFGDFKASGWLDPLHPALILPEVLDDSKWLGGFQAGFADQDKSLVYNFVSYIDMNVHVNRDAIPETQLNKLDQLWDPRWAGRIAMQDPSTPSSGAQVAATWLVAKGEDRLRAFLRDQQPVYTRDRRQLGEWVIRGRYPIVVGAVPSVLQGFQEQGLSIEHVKPLVDDDPAVSRLSHGSGALGLVNKAPHPNAARVLINWLLSQEGLTVFAQRTGYNVRRTDVLVTYPDQLVDPTKQYLELTDEANMPTYLKAVAIARELVR